MTLDTVSRYIVAHINDNGFTYFERDDDDTYFKGTGHNTKTIKLTDEFGVLEGMGGFPVLSPEMLLEYAKVQLHMSSWNDELRERLKKYEQV